MRKFNLFDYEVLDLTESKNIFTVKCPICSAEMFFGGEKVLKCKGIRSHSYDVSSSGYVNLASPKQSGGGDTKEAVRARSDFLNKGFYEPIANKTVELLSRFCDFKGTVIDAGCGEGYYTSKIADLGCAIYGFDISKPAVESAAKRAKREAKSNLFFAVASVYSLPVFDSSASAIVNIFAPCVEEEYTRVLKNGGALIVVQAGTDHLMGLKKVLYDNIRENDVRADLPKQLEFLHEERLKYAITVNGNKNVMSLFAMTPYYWRTSQNDIKKLEQTENLDTEIDIIFSVYKKISR